MKKGFSLLELVIAMALFAVVVSAIAVIQMAAQDNFTEGTVEGDLERSGISALDEISDNFVDCKITTAPTAVSGNEFSVLKIQVPVLVGGVYWDAAANIYWGANNTQNCSLKYMWVQSQDLISPYDTDDVLAEATDRKDWNRDGDITDTFKLGRLVEIQLDASDNAVLTRTICTYVMVSNTNNYADINGDGTNDPIFQFLDAAGTAVTAGGNRLRINLWLGGRTGAQQNPVIVNIKREIALLNPQ
ncbi:MAG: prepilin-type N-terminal cleavage/methylation domain-containing protein [Candidatus Brocadiia bacterium]